MLIMLTLASTLKPYEYCGGSQVPDHHCRLLCQGQGKPLSAVLIAFISKDQSNRPFQHAQASDILIAAAPISIKKQDLADLELGVSCMSSHTSPCNHMSPWHPHQIFLLQSCLSINEQFAGKSS